MGFVFVPGGSHPCTMSPIGTSCASPSCWLFSPGPLVDSLFLDECGDGVSGLRVSVHFLGPL